MNAQTTDATVLRAVARMETWFAVQTLNARTGSPDVGFMLQLVDQDSAALEASALGL